MICEQRQSLLPGKMRDPCPFPWKALFKALRDKERARAICLSWIITEGLSPMSAGAYSTSTLSPVFVTATMTPAEELLTSDQAVQDPSP